MSPVKVINEKELDHFRGDTFTQIKELFQTYNGSAKSEFGEILLSKKSAKTILNHKFNKLKAYGLGAIKEVIENGKVIYYCSNYKNRQKDRIDIAAPITISKGDCAGEYIMGVAIDFSSTSNRAELIELALDNKEGESHDCPIGEKPPTQVEDSPSMLTLLQQVVEVKNGTRDLDQVTAIGIDSE